MREPNLGISRDCVVCGRRYWCEDGDPVCPSFYCQQESEAPCCEICDEVMEEETESGLCISCEEDIAEESLDEEFEIEKEPALV